MKFFKYGLTFLFFIILLYSITAKGFFGSLPEDGQVSLEKRPLATLEESLDKQIFFGDLHVHTTFSQDAFLFSLPMLQGEGAHPPADACNFARFCSALDFFSINDHAEGISKRMWDETVSSLRTCELKQKDKPSDLIAFAGWEWTQMGDKPENHYGHKNIILRDLEEVPDRPIGAGMTGIDMLINSPILPATILLADFPPETIDFNFLKYRKEIYSIPLCSSGEEKDFKECRQNASTPKELFQQLDDLGLDSLVIPHGTTWGIHAPEDSSLSMQLMNEQHDPEKQRLIEIYSGHGNSEIFKDIKHVLKDEKGNSICPPPSKDFEPCCWRAGQIAFSRCQKSGGKNCNEEKEITKKEFVNNISNIFRFGLVENTEPEDWKQCGQLQNSFLPAYTYRPKMSTQAALASVKTEDVRKRFKLGLIGSSDNHKARSGSGYKEFARKAMGDAWGAKKSLTWLLPPERGASFYSTGGLVAVHAKSLHRDEIFDSLYNREVYATSGERILLWFDLIHPDMGRIPMGSELSLTDSELTFSVKAVGSFQQKPGCPDYVHTSLDKEEISRLCLNECYNPSNERNKIERIEIVKIKVSENIDSLQEAIEDPWKVFQCNDIGEGCKLEFRDSVFLNATEEIVYYIRAIQEPSLAVGGDPLRCKLDEEGNCIETNPCYASGSKFDPTDDCLAPIGERAWSSPIFISSENSS